MPDQHPIEFLIQDKALAEIIDTGDKIPNDFSGAARHRFNSYKLVAFNGWKFVYTRVYTGAIVLELYVSGNKYFRELIKNNAALEVFWSGTEIAHALESIT